MIKDGILNRFDLNVFASEKHIRSDVVSIKLFPDLNHPLREHSR
jgi:hypothetical protein